MRLTKDDSEVNLANGEADPEFSEWKWSTPEEVIEQVCYRNFTHQYRYFCGYVVCIESLVSILNEWQQAVDYKRPTYEEVMKTFRPYFSGSANSAKCRSAKW